MSRMNPMFKSPLYSNPNRSTTNLFSPPSQSTAKKPKSISIPIRFVDSNKIVSKVDPSSAAIKIQKIFRGFLVRKNLKTVRKIEEEVNEIDLKYQSGEEMDHIVRDEKERIKVGEMLMRFLFRLDSVRGVRDYRKKVIRRIISIQEMLDSIAKKNIGSEVEVIKSVITEEVNAKTEEIEWAESSEAVNVIENTNDMKMADSSEANENDVNACDAKVHEPNDTKNVVESMDQNAETNDEDKSKDMEDDMMVVGNENVSKIEKRRIDTDSEKVKIEDKNEIQNLRIGFDNDNKKQRIEDLNEKLKTENDKMKSIMENMMMENAKLKDLVAELCARSAQQCKLMGGIAERVENLEKTVKKMKKDKKRK